MSSQVSVRLLVGDDSENRAHEVDSALRNMGISTRFSIAATPQAARDAFETDKVDLMLLHHSMAEFPATLGELRKLRPELPIIVSNDSAAPEAVLNLIEQGATDVVDENQRNLLGKVIEREISHACLRYRFQQTRAQIRELEERCELLLSVSAVPIAYVHEGMHIFANSEYAALFGYTDADDLVGVPFLDLISADATDTAKQQLKELREANSSVTFDCEGKADDGEAFNAKFVLAPTEYEGEQCTQVLVKPSTLPIAAKADSPEAPANGGSTIDQFLAHLSASADANSDRQHVLLLAQIDGFDKAQKTMGIRTANQLAQVVGAELEAAVGLERYSRIDNHRYAMHVSGASQLENQKTIDGLRERIEHMICEIDARTSRATVSIVCVPCDTAPSTESAMDEGFMMAIGLEGSNQVVWYEPTVEEDNPASVSAQVLRQVNLAIEKHSFTLLFQPIISLRGDEDEHYEVFLRMINEADEQVAPDQFLRTAIENGVAGKIDRWVVLQSIKMLSGHRSRGHDTRLTINLTANSIADAEFVQWLSVAIKAARLPSDAVIFQITEEDAASHIHQTRSFMETLQNMHVRSSLSRFGLMANPAELLEHVPVDFVKLDGSHVRAMDSDDAAREALMEMIRTLQNRGKLTIVPMVENAQILSTLWQAGANYIQGHYLQEPTEKMTYDFTTGD